MSQFLTFQKQLLSSPTISHDDDDQQSDGATASTDGDKEKDTDPEEDDTEEEREDLKTETTEDVQTNDDKKKQLVLVEPLSVIYQNRDILDLASNAYGPGQFVQYTVLPENNVNCFFQNRAQYWRLNSNERQEYSMEKCPCCDFTYPSTQHLNQGPPQPYNKNAVTDSLLMFLKNSEQMTAPPVNPVKRFMNNSTPFAYQMQQPPQPQQYQAPVNGFFNNNNSFNSNCNQQPPPMNPFMGPNNGGGNNNNGYNTTLALLNLMNNASRSAAASAFQALGNPNPRYNNSFMNNGYGLYKQF